MKGCQPGWKGRYCNISCPNGSYGKDCKFSCGNCRNLSECNRFTGKCETGCLPKYHGHFCVNRCPSGRYGTKCKNLCGNCVNFHCDYHTGHCKRGCKEGYRKPLCKDFEGISNGNFSLSSVEKKNSFAKKTGFTIIGVTLTIGLLIFCLLCIIRYRKVVQSKIDYGLIPEAQIKTESKRNKTFKNDESDDASVIFEDDESSTLTKYSSINKKKDFQPKKKGILPRLQTPYLTEYSMNVLEDRTPVLQYGHASGGVLHPNDFDDI